jgi:hypothetical protein
MNKLPGRVSTRLRVIRGGIFQSVHLNIHSRWFKKEPTTYVHDFIEDVLCLDGLDMDKTRGKT